MVQDNSWNKQKVESSSDYRYNKKKNIPKAEILGKLISKILSTLTEKEKQ